VDRRPANAPVVRTVALRVPVRISPAAG